jgi:signal-transduction protein with cAMP-binding, CBS, and nucleotidyltransferase domain
VIEGWCVILVTINLSAMDTLLKYLESFAAFSPELREFLLKTVKARSIRKKEYLLKAGRSCENIYFVSKGIIHCDYEDKDRPVSCWFMKEGDVIILDSFCNQVPSDVNLRALEDATVYYISYRELHFLESNFSEFNAVTRKVTAKVLGKVWNYFRHTNHQPAELKYKFFLDYFPDLGMRIPLKLIAAFLNVSPEWLGKIRTKLNYVRVP